MLQHYLELCLRAQAIHSTKGNIMHAKASDFWTLLLQTDTHGNQYRFAGTWAICILSCLWAGIKGLQWEGLDGFHTSVQTLLEKVKNSNISNKLGYQASKYGFVYLSNWQLLLCLVGTIRHLKHTKISIRYAQCFIIEIWQLKGYSSRDFFS